VQKTIKRSDIKGFTIGKGSELNLEIVIVKGWIKSIALWNYTKLLFRLGNVN